MPYTVPTDKEELKRFIKRRHPEYADNLTHWEFLESCYRGGRDWFEKNIFRYHKEGNEEFDKRKERAYRFNHTREAVDLVVKYIFKGEIHRNWKDAPDSVKKFWKGATRRGAPIEQFSINLAAKASMLGRIWVVVDSTLRQPVKTRAEEKRAKARVYAYVVPPQDAWDFAYDENGVLSWILIHETKRDDSDPFSATGDVKHRARLWTRESWFLFDIKETKDNDIEVTLAEQGDHNLGVVPVFSVDSQETDSNYTAPALIADIAYLDRAVANYLSNLDAIIQDQTFSQLAIPAQNLLPGTNAGSGAETEDDISGDRESYERILEMGTKRIFTYDGEGGGKPEYLSPDPKQAGVIISVINKIIAEIYHTIGMAGERTKQDNAAGIDNSSGVAKAYDFERMNALLVSKAATLDSAEQRLIELVALWSGEKFDPEQDLVKYPDSFDVRGIYDEFEIAERLTLISAPDEVRREQMKTLVDKMFPRLAKELKEKIRKSIEDWPPDPTELMGATPPLAGKPSLLPKENRQGQVTDKDQRAKAA